MLNPPGRYGRPRAVPAAFGALGLLVSIGACSSGAAPRGDAKTDTLGGADTLSQASAALSVSIAEAPATLAFEFDLDGQHVELSLERAHAPTTSDYRSFRRTADGKLTALPAPDLDCTYRGVTELSGESAAIAPGFAAMSVCASATRHVAGQAASGVITIGGRLWRISPDPLDQDDSDGVDHLAEPMRRPDASGRVVGDVRHVTLRRLPESIAPRLAFREGTDEETKYIDLIAVNDAERVDALGEDTQAATLQFVDTMNALLEGSGLTPRLRVTLRAQVLFDPDPYTPVFDDGEVDNDSLLDLFLDWGASEDGLPDHDERMLLSGYDFVGGVVGYAGLSVACTTNSNGFIVQAGRASGGFAVLSAVHELGHTLGMNHDDGSPGCPQSGFIMAAVGCGNCPGADQAEFSPCSLEQFQDYLSGPQYAGPRCADDVPVNATPSCGDGAVQEGETCDCGSSDCSDIDPCCNGATCQLQGDAECSDFNDGCCQNCAIVGADDAVVCRSARSVCDIVETCSGTSKDCPADTFQAAGEECEDDRGNTGACYFGDCRSRGTQCEQIAESQNNPQLDNVGDPGTRCGTPCNVVVCGNGPNGCITIQGPNVIDGVRCNNGGQCVDEECVATIDQCPEDPAKEDPGACGCGRPDSDADADGSADCDDGCDDDPSKQAPGECGCGEPDTDSDGDGSADCNDACPTDASKSEPGDCGCGQADVDTDSDGTADCIDLCPTDAQRREPGACGCGMPDIDSDFDGTPDCVDGCITDATHTAPPCTVTGGTDTDGDGDVDVAVNASVKAKGGCAIAAPGVADGSGSARGLGALGGLALVMLPLWRRRRRG